MLLGGAAGLYPTLLPSVIDPLMDLTIYNSKTGEYGLRVGTIWWSIGMVLAIGYFVFLYRSVRGKVNWTAPWKMGMRYRLQAECLGSKIPPEGGT